MVLVWLGYSAFYYGYNRITGGNDTFVSLIYPGRYSPTPRDTDQPSSSSAAAPTAATTPTASTTTTPTNTVTTPQGTSVGAGGALKG
jgi:hypothetical protein